MRLQRVANCRQENARESGPLRRLLLLAAVLCASLGARALPASAEGEPLVARVAFTEGEVSYLNADAEEWAPVEVNAPLVTGDRFYAGDGGRAEIQLPGSLYARLSSGTELDLLEVSEAAVQVRVGIGTATFRVREVPARMHVEISTPASAVVARARGVYRIDVDRDGRTTVVVREGEADAYVGDERFRIDSGRGAEFLNVGYDDFDGGDPVRVFPASEIQPDPWDEWEGSRARRLEASASFQYVSDDVYGVEDLDEYGAWDRHETYGPIWRPRVEVGWAPYTRGRWVWQDPWGWTWVDYQPWGWAPSHYGRWVYVQDYWAWAPGPVVTRPIYAPATVGFLGVSVNTPNVSVNIGIGGGPSVGWVPLGWGEPIVPWWGGVGGVTVGRPWWGGWGGPRIVNNTVINNTTINNININNIRYSNIDRPWGVTAVSRDSFVRGDFQRLDLPRDQIHNIVRPVRGAPEIIPQRESLFAARPDRLRGGRAVRPTDDVLQRAAVTTRDIPRARPRFDEKRQAIERGKGAPVNPGELRRMGREREPLVRTVSATGRKAVTPEIVASVDRGGRSGLGGRGNEAARERGAPGSNLTTSDSPNRAGRGNERDAQGRDAQGNERRRLGAQEGGETGRTAVERPNDTREGRTTARERAASEPRGTERSAVQGRGNGRTEANQGPGQGEEATRGRAAVGRANNEDRTGRAAREDATPRTREGGNARAQREEKPNQRTTARGGSEATDRGRTAVTRDRAAEPQQRSSAQDPPEQQRKKTERSGRDTAARPQQDRAAEQQRQSMRNQQEQAERGRRESAQREQKQQQERAAEQQQRQSVRNQQEQAERGRRESAQRQQKQQQSRAAEQQRQSMRNQQEQAERGRRESAQRQQQQQQQQQRAAEQQRQSMRNQRQQAERAAQRSAGREQARPQREARAPEQQQVDRSRNDRRTQANARQADERGGQERGRRAL